MRPYAIRASRPRRHMRCTCRRTSSPGRSVAAVRRANRKSQEAAKLAGGVTDQLHAFDYWEYADLQLARDSEAREIVASSQSLTEPSRAADYARAAIPARFAVERGQWKEAAGLPDPDESKFPYASAIRFFARALGAARSGDTNAAERDLSRLRDEEKSMVAAHDDY
jgi:hypothetical protein